MAKKNKAAKKKKIPKIKPINNFALMAFLTLFEAVTAFSAAWSPELGIQYQTLAAMGILIVVEWAYLIVFYTAMHRRNFELEMIAFFLCATGISVIGSVSPSAALKQCLMIVAGVIVYIVMVFLLGNVDLCMKLRLPVAIAALLLLLVNLIIAETTNGARNWITIGGENGITLQPSEFVKVAFIFVGAATLEKIQTSKNIFAFIGFAVACVGSLILIRDFGTALIFFITFIIIAFMTSGDIKTIILAVASAVLGVGIVLRYRSYVMARFSVYRHVWEADYYNTSGYQQTRTLVGLASGGLFGIGIGNGYTRNVYASTTDLIFGVICEEWGYVFGVILVLAFVAIAVSALVNSIAARSTFYSIAAVAAAGLLLFQTALNIFGITDVLPLTGVTLPFVSQGGSSMISCWAILAYIKASDVRTYNYLGGAKKK
ncbi:MAG TPA: FtsW/RodA/SpoVE family cell cycle protein [Candidatus Eubacterium faecipullorum]|uniref:FtsW/RodA/SpoVE family cell cycle protein n=1 Tax=Candidatus Eubacterium faecipullorum TaxID=2838571 RepID=A0A9D1RE82_9FIRM|nr:FtsW/RodA/SpoVE family cell cycle protein [Candidatus Eubacterium faecipullorum]